MNVFNSFHAQRGVHPKLALVYCDDQNQHFCLLEHMFVYLAPVISQLSFHIQLKWLFNCCVLLNYSHLIVVFVGIMTFEVCHRFFSKSPLQRFLLRSACLWKSLSVECFESFLQTFGNSCLEIRNFIYLSWRVNNFGKSMPFGYFLVRSLMWFKCMLKLFPKIRRNGSQTFRLFLSLPKDNKR